MNLSADALLFLAAKGMSVEDIAEFVRLTEKRKDPTAAERMQRYRARKKTGETVTRNVTANPPIDITHTPNPDISPDGENQGAAPKARPNPRQKSSPTPIPDDWEPVLTPAAQRTVDGWPPGMFDRQVEAFRNHAADKGRKSKDWQAAFRTWITRADDWKPKNDYPARREPPRRDEIQNPYARAVAARQAARAGDEWGQPGSWSECG